MSRRASRRAGNRRSRLQLEVLEDRLAPSVTLGQQPGAPNNTQFHDDSLRTGFNSVETVLTPTNVASSLGQVWQSPQLDGTVYATPLYLDSLLISGPGNAANHTGDGVQSPSFQNQTLGVVFAATGGGTVYAIAAQDTNGPTGIAPGTILWKTHLGNPYAGVDGNSIGVLSTPIIDLKSGRIYVTASVTDYLSAAGNPNHGGNNFEVFALSLHDGSLISGWPLIYTQSLLDSLNQNTLQGSGIAVPFSSGGADQRGALNLSPDGSTLYVDYACYGSSNPGWLTTVATGITNGVANGQTAAIVSAYSAVDSTAVNANGGMWGAGGPAIDASGNVFVTTGDSPGGTGNSAGDWGNSILEFGPGQTLTLTGVYTPWNYPTQDTIDSDVGGSSPILINLPTGSSTTTELAAFSGKQGNGYLVDAGNHLNNPTPNPNNSPASYPASLTARPPSNLTPDQDASLYDTTSTGVRSYWQGYPPQDGPLALFGPYNESSASGNTAKARDTPVTFTGPDGSQYVIFAGSTKSGVGSGTPVAPSLIVTKIVHAPGQPAYLQVVAQNNEVMSNPGSSLVTGNGTANEIDWIVDSGVQRTDSLTSFANGAPVLYAFNALTMQPIWSSAYEELAMGGKYNSIAVARGDVFVGTNRIQAFGLTSDTIVNDSVTGAGIDQFNYVGSGWTHVTGSSTMGTFDGTVSTDNVHGDYATLTFTGSQIKVYSNEVSGYGTATFSVDGAHTQTVSLSPSNNSPNGAGAGDVMVYSVSGLGPGTHTFEILNNAAGNVISLDRVEITPPAGTPAQLGISLTDGNITPTAQGVIPYTINYNNAGSVVNGTGTGAAGVVLTETVPANTTADLADSTPGWTLASGNGGAGSTYTFAVGNLGAGITGSAVFSVTLNANIPVGTTSITDSVTISDSAGDQAAGSRTTPIPPLVLTANQAIYSPNGQFELIMQGDGNLVEYGPGGQVIWNSGTYGNPGAYAIMQGDGNLVVYSSAGTALWNSGTYGNAGAYFQLQDNGNAVIYRANGTVLWYGNSSAAPGRVLTAGQAIYAPHGQYDLVMQGDGNLVDYGPGGQVLWNAGTWGNPGAYAIMQGDGNLVVYSSAGAALWNSGTNGNPGAYFQLQDNGNAVIYRANGTALWYGNSTAAPGRVLTANQSIYSPDGQYQLIMQGDGNLVEYGPAGQVLFNAGTWGNPGAYAIMQGDGNLVVYSPAGTALWNSRTNGHAGASLVLDDGGTLEILYLGTVIWSV